MILRRENTELGEMVYIKSSNIDRICYDNNSMDLYIYFLNGKCYKYKNIPLLTYRTIINSDSVGKAFIKEIKSRSGIEYEQIL